MTFTKPEPLTRRPRWVTFALAQGVVAPVLFALIAIAGGLMRPGYSHISQAISELTEAGAINKSALDVSLLIMELLTILFGLGFFWMARTLDLRLRLSAAFLVIIGFLGLFFYCYPMDPLGTGMTPDGRKHLIIVTLSAVAAMASVYLSAQGWFRLAAGRGMALMCYIVLAIMVISGAVSVIVGIWQGPGIGVWQRINTGAFSVWEIVTAVWLLRTGSGAG